MQLINLIRLVGFQPRLSVIPASIFVMMMDFFHLIIIFLIIALPSSILVVILVGPVNADVDTFSKAFIGVLTMFITGAAGEG
jgi:hypothetical protein